MRFGIHQVDEDIAVSGTEVLRCEVFFSDTWSCICLLFTYRRDCGEAGVLVTRFGIRWIEDDVALSEIEEEAEAEFWKFSIF